MLSLLTRIASRRTVTMFLLKTVGMFAPSYSSTALCVQRMKNPTYRCGRDDLSFDLVFFNTLEELTLPIKGPMEDAGVTVIKLYVGTIPNTVSVRGSRARREHGG